MTYTNKDEDDIVNDILLTILDNVTDINDANVGSVLRNFVEAISEEIKNLYDALDTIYEGTRISTSTGTDLEQLGALVGISRKAGTESQGYVTFKRNTVGSADFIIPANSIIGTQPVTGEDQLRFVTLTNATFDVEILDEQHTYYSGVTNYRMDERFLGDTSNIVVTGLISSVTSTVTSYVVSSSFTGYLLDVDNITVIDDCDDLTGWTSGVGATAMETSTTRVEPDFSLALGKTISTSDSVYYEKNFASRISGNSLKFVPFLRLNSTGYSRVNKIDFYFSDNSNVNQSYKYTVNVADIPAAFEDDWYYTAIDTSTGGIKVGNPSISNLNYLKVVLTTNEDTDTLVAGDVLMDFLSFSDVDYYIGDIIKFDENGTSLPDHDTTIYVDYKPLSKDILCESNAVGAEYNVNRNKITYKITNISNITSINNYEIMSGGSDEELDSALRTRILYASELQGKGTSESIRQAVLAVNGVSACTVNDTPIISMTSEPHIYDTAIDKYKMDFEVLYLDNITSPTNLTVIGTVSGSADHTFVYSTDYIRVTDDYGTPTSQLQWQATGDKPDDTTTFYVDYQANWLGHVNVFVTGVENPLPTSVLIEVEEAVEDTRAAGVETTISTPDDVDVDVTASFTADTGYTFTALESDVEIAIFNYISDLSAGDDVYVSGIIEAIMSVTGVLNCSVTAPAADTEIDNDEIAVSNVITLSEL